MREVAAGRPIRGCACISAGMYVLPREPVA